MKQIKCLVSATSIKYLRFNNKLLRYRVFHEMSAGALSKKPENKRGIFNKHSQMVYVSEIYLKMALKKANN